jgi:surfeit locus 1 family protein
MMLRRLPLVPTLVVLVAVAIMIRLGFWQLDRMHEKEALLARYGAAEALSSEVPWPASPAEATERLYRRATLDCQQVIGVTAIAGQSANGEPGQAHVADCRLAGGAAARVVLGWSRNPAEVAWAGGLASGIVAPGPRLVADPPLAGLAASRRPDPAELPNNHFAYAVQWFVFAVVALVIYALAVRRRLQNPPRHGEGDHPKDGGGAQAE